MKILSGANQPKDIVSKEYVDGQINNHVHDANEIPCESKTLKLGSKEYKISENLQNALENLLDYIYMNASGVLDLQTNLKSVSDTVSKIPSYKGGTGISVAGNTIGHSNNTLPGMVGTGEILTPDFGDTVYTTWFSYDAQGHVTQSGTGGFVIPTVQADDSLSDTSTNPLQNKTVKAKFDAVDSQISSLGIDNGNLWARVKTKADNTAEGATALLGNLSESNTAPGDEDEVIIKNLNQYTHRPLTKLLNWIKSNLAKVATSGSYNDLTNKPDIPTVDSSFSESGTNAVAGNVILSALNSKANKTELQALSNQVSNKADAEHTHAYLPLAGGTMTGMLKTQSLYAPYERNKSDTNDNVPVSGAVTTLKSFTGLNAFKTFIGTVITTGGVWNNIISIRHRNGVNDGANYGMYLRTALTADGSLVWNKQISASSWVGERILLDSNNYKTYITPANIGAASSTHNHDNTYLKKSAVTSQSVIYTSTTSANSATITGLFTNYSLIWLQVVGSKTTHTHVIPLNYLGSKSSLMFKDSGVPFNIIKDSDTSIRWFEYQGQGAETYTSVTIVKII